MARWCSAVFVIAEGISSFGEDKEVEESEGQDERADKKKYYQYMLPSCPIFFGNAIICQGSSLELILCKARDCIFHEWKVPFQDS